MIELKNITMVYDKTPVLKDVSVTINKGDVIAIIGPSGTGKSTLLNCINQIVHPTEGHVYFHGADLTDSKCDIQKYRRRIGMVFQQFNLFGHMTVLENVIVPQIDLLKRGRQEACDTAMEYLRLVGMSEKVFSYPETLSGGQKQRVAIARTLAMDPEVILFDEPTSALDPTMVGEVLYVVKKLAQSGRTMVLVTHEMNFARDVSNRVFYMDEQGIYEDGPTEQIFGNPKREKTRRFIQRLRCLEMDYYPESGNLIEDMKKIEQYGDKLEFSRNRINKMQLLFEEVCVQTLTGVGRVHVEWVYSIEKDILSMTVSHAGKPKIAYGCNEIADKLIKTLSNEIKLKENIT